MLAGLGAAGCAPTVGAPRTAGPVRSAPVPPVLPDGQLAALLDRASVTGVVVVLPPRGPALASTVDEATVRHLPASTFKVANTLLGLDLGHLDGADSVLPWDGVVRPEFPEWNREHTLTSAFAVSNVPWFQTLARRIGPDAMRAGLVRLGYGNQAMGEVVDRFWLDGPLAISALEQVQFLQRLERGALPVSDHARAVTREVLVRERRGESTLRGKTGWGRMRAPDEVGWFVGYAGDGLEATYVAVRVHRDPALVDDASFRALRMDLARDALVAAGAYPAGPPG